MLSWFRAVAQEARDAASGLKVVRAVGRGVREMRDVPLMQQRGFVSVPMDGDTILVLRANDLEVAIASSSTDRPTAEEGETIVYAAKDTFIRIMPDGTVRIDAKKIQLGSDDPVANPLDGIVTMQCVCSLTGAPHPMASSVAFARKA